MEKPEITYPCRWPFRIIGVDIESISNAIDVTLAGYPYCKTSGNTSNKGTYASLHVEVDVIDEGMRNTIYSSLKKITGVKMVF